MGENVTLGRDGAIATVTLNRPDRRNSLSDVKAPAPLGLLAWRGSLLYETLDIPREPAVL